jgi:hypothetical protein
MDILAGMLAYLAGIGAIIAAIAVSFSVFFSTPRPPSEPQSAAAMVARPAPANKNAAPRAKHSIAHHDRRSVTTSVATTAPATTPANDVKRKAILSAAQLRRLVQEERARRFAYQQEPNFQSHFLGYAE